MKWFSRKSSQRTAKSALDEITVACEECGIQQRISLDRISHDKRPVCGQCRIPLKYVFTPFQRAQVVAAYEKVLEEHKEEWLRMESDLPIPKGVIVHALIEEIMTSEPPNPEMLRRLGFGFMYLELFLPDANYGLVTGLDQGIGHFRPPKTITARVYRE